MRFAYRAESHVGRVRGNNEDSAFAGPHLLLVADGVGGAAAGEVASASVAFAVSALSMTPRPSLPAEPSDLLGELRAAVEAASHHLREGVAADPARTGMATTLTAVLTDGHRFALAHIGDSRAYLLREGQLSQLTTDHTLVQALIDKGHLTRDEAAVHPHRSVVTRSVNATNEVTPDLTLLDLRDGDRLLLCSDGLTDLVVDDEQLTAALRESSRDDAAQRLIGAALQAGGYDNVTCVVADVDSRALMPWSRRPYYCDLQGALTNLGNLVDPAAPYRAA